jgi:hypothetical protein
MICLPATHTSFTKEKVGKKEEERKKKESHLNRYRDKSTNGALLYYKGGKTPWSLMPFYAPRTSGCLTSVYL